jgi:hypothetical protein
MPDSALHLSPDEERFFRTVPERHRATCEFCGSMLDTRLDGTHQYVSGWVKNRTGGGGHGISLPERENRWAHGACIDSATKGFLQQGGLF